MPAALPPVVGSTTAAAVPVVAAATGLQASQSETKMVRSTSSSSSSSSFSSSSAPQPLSSATNANASASSILKKNVGGGGAVVVGSAAVVAILPSKLQPLDSTTTGSHQKNSSISSGKASPVLGTTAQRTSPQLHQQPQAELLVPMAMKGTSIKRLSGEGIPSVTSVSGTSGGAAAVPTGSVKRKTAVSAINVTAPPAGDAHATPTQGMTTMSLGVMPLRAPSPSLNPTSPSPSPAIASSSSASFLAPSPPQPSRSRRGSKSPLVLPALDTITIFSPRTEVALANEEVRQSRARIAEEEEKKEQERLERERNAAEEIRAAREKEDKRIAAELARLRQQAEQVEDVHTQKMMDELLASKGLARVEGPLTPRRVEALQAERARTAAAAAAAAATTTNAAEEHHKHQRHGSKRHTSKGLEEDHTHADVLRKSTGSRSSLHMKKSDSSSDEEHQSPNPNTTTGTHLPAVAGTTQASPVMRGHQGVQLSQSRLAIQQQQQQQHDGSASTPMLTRSLSPQPVPASTLVAHSPNILHRSLEAPGTSAGSGVGAGAGLPPRSRSRAGSISGENAGKILLAAQHGTAESAGPAAAAHGTVSHVMQPTASSANKLATHATTSSSSSSSSAAASSSHASHSHKGHHKGHHAHASSGTGGTNGTHKSEEYILDHLAHPPTTTEDGSAPVGDSHASHKSLHHRSSPVTVPNGNGSTTGGPSSHSSHSPSRRRSRRNSLPHTFTVEERTAFFSQVPSFLQEMKQAQEAIERATQITGMEVKLIENRMMGKDISQQSLQQGDATAVSAASKSAALAFLTSPYHRQPSFPPELIHAYELHRLSCAQLVHAGVEIGRVTGPEIHQALLFLRAHGMVMETKNLAQGQPHYESTTTAGSSSSTSGSHSAPREVAAAIEPLLHAWALFGAGYAAGKAAAHTQALGTEIKQTKEEEEFLHPEEKEKKTKKINEEIQKMLVVEETAQQGASSAVTTAVGQKHPHATTNASPSSSPPPPRHPEAKKSPALTPVSPTTPVVSITPPSATIVTTTPVVGVSASSSHAATTTTTTIVSKSGAGSNEDFSLGASIVTGSIAATTTPSATIS